MISIPKLELEFDYLPRPAPLSENAMTATAPRAPVGKIPVLNKLAYGTGDMAGSAIVTITGFFLTAFLLDVAGLRPRDVGIIFLVANIWDAITDPAMGVLIDRTRTRWGSKRVWLLVGAFPFGLAYFLNWVVPPLSGLGLAGYYLVIAMLLRTAFTVVGIPYSALTSAMTRDYDERTRLNTYRFSLNLFGSLLAVILHPVLVGLAGDDVVLGNVISAAFFGLFIATTTLVAFSGTFELPESQSRSQGFNVFGELFSAFASGPFRYVTLIYVCTATALFVVQNNLLLYTRYAVNVESSFTVIILIFQLTTILFLTVWGLVAQRVGKRVVYAAGATVWMIGLAALLFGPVGATTYFYIVGFLTGAGAAAAAYLVPWSLLPDVIDEDELRRGQRREGIFYSMFLFIQKIALSLGLAFSGFALEAAGYLNPEVAGAAVVQPEAVVRTLRLLVSVVPVAALLLSLPLIYFYPITRERYAEIRAQLAARQPQASVEPAAPVLPL